MNDTNFESIKNRELLRCKALLNNDLEQLAALVTEDLVHVHATGRVDNKIQWLAAIQNEYRFHSIERSSFQTYPMGDLTLLIAPIEQHVEVRASGKLHQLRAITTQFWRQEADEWCQCFFQSSAVE
jgi:ketosteroid isomerase-like protein